MEYDVYTDGSAKNNGKEDCIGAWGYIVLKDGEVCFVSTHSCRDTTNQRMELHAAIEACNWFKSELAMIDMSSILNIYTDSAYLYNCYKDKWYINWQNNNWLNSKKEPVANKDLWLQLIEYFENPNIFFNKVIGHSGNKWNNYVDQLVQDKAASCVKSLAISRRDKNARNNNTSI